MEIKLWLFIFFIKHNL